ncbi:cobalamin biosynthesis protein CobD/CbiB [Pseudoalteromonas sp. PA2MD11]|uniref:cobalamin biosynthesis protein CobD/CbiB n=1 Tax=Pseudoalteromonas sp. PA2MD11 TaxID=2785057 RepID=UPI001ADEF27C|nr:regulatory signaling modulator protein AmpE [Pseudoalteromonas sp. PA2MD11]
MIANIVQNHLDIIVFFVALLAERFFPLVSWYHPNTFLTVIFSALSDRLYNPTNPKSYQYLASTLAFTLTILVIVTLVVLFLEFAFYPELLSGLVLYLLLSSRAQEKKSLRIARLLKLNQKATARELLSSLVARDVSRLSASGICKATMESLVLQSARHYFAVIFFYLLGGAILALVYRLLTLIHQAWRKNQKPNNPFLAPIAKLLFVLEWLPTRLVALTIAATNASRQSIHYIKHYGRHFYQTNTGWLLSVTSAALQVQLGGPALYQGERFNKMRVGTDRLPDADDIPALVNRLNQAKAFWLLLIIAIEVATLFIN